MAWTVVAVDACSTPSRAQTNDVKNDAEEQRYDRRDDRSRAVAKDKADLKGDGESGKQG